MTDTSGEKQPAPGLADAQVTGGGGHEPDLDDTGAGDGQAKVPAAGSGVDMKSDNLGDED